MAQEQTDKTMTPDTDLKDGKVRPKSKVKVLFLNSKHHSVPFVIEEVHPALAAKLVEAGKAEMAKGGLTKEQKDANKEHMLAKAKSKGRVGKPPVEEGIEDKDLLGDKGSKGKESSKLKETQL